MKTELLKWASAVMAALLVFSIGILAIGYQPLSMGRAMTMLMLLCGSIICLFLAKRRG